jgi:hypothetical protein
MNIKDTIRAAHELADHFQWSVFPVNPKTKAPFFKGWQESASSDLGQIEQLFGPLRYAAIGVRTGACSNLVVIDIDERPKYSGLASFEQAGFEWPETIVAKTPSGGLHLYFRSNGSAVKNSASVLAQGIDVRGEGGYIIAPPSLTVFGYYRWECSEELMLAGPSDIPVRYLDALNQVGQRTRVPQNSSTVSQNLLTPVGEGGRNVEMTRRCGFLLKKYNPTDAWQLLSRINIRCCEPPLEERELGTIFRSIRHREGK